MIASPPSVLTPTIVAALMAVLVGFAIPAAQAMVDGGSSGDSGPLTGVATSAAMLLGLGFGIAAALQGRGAGLGLTRLLALVALAGAGGSVLLLIQASQAAGDFGGLALLLLPVMYLPALLPGLGLVIASVQILKRTGAEASPTHDAGSPPP